MNEFLYFLDFVYYHNLLVSGSQNYLNEYYCSFFLFYVLNQKKIILVKGIGIIDLFKIKNYTISFNTIHNIEPIKEDLFKITYMHRERFYVFKLYVSSDNVSEFKQIIRKKTKFKKI